MIRQPIPTALEELSAAREATCRWLSESGWPEESLGDVSLVVTELVANAIIHGQQPAELEARLSDDAVRIEVRDAEPNGPVINPQPSWAGGFGLRIVERVAPRWGWEPLASGKVVWAEVPRTSTTPVSVPRSH